MVSLFTDRLLVYVDKIDEQHEKIFRVVEKFQKACSSQGNKEELIELFNTLKIYMEEHFEEEERYMIEYAYPHYGEHKENHNIFARKMSMLEKTVSLDYISLTKIAEINEFISEGFITHISDVDSKLGEYLQDKL